MHGKNGDQEHFFNKLLMHHLTAGRNLALLCARPQSIREFSHVFCTRFLTDQCTASNKSTGGGNCYTFPLFLYPAEGLSSRWGSAQINLKPSFADGVAVRLRKRAKTGDPQSTDIEPLSIFQYTYALLHSPTYRSRYSPFLRNEYPRVQITSDPHLFAALSEKGEELVLLHLMESPKLANFITRYEQAGDHTVEKVRYAEPNAKVGIEGGRVYINGAQYFDGVPKEVWEFQIGGYQVCEKWLKDRKGRKLSSDDIDHYQKTVVALNETIRLMREIDEIIPGWPLP
ncbi:MAG: type ISP restriction/modification enzyme [Candidatus Acidiferrales bacterium]